jgi:uncharacterized RDD family membrane protein YckC
MSKPPEGWYPDPAGGPGRRWWDGGRWTEYTDLPPAEAAAQAQYGDVAGYGQPAASGVNPQQVAYGQPVYTYGQGLQSRFPAPYASFWLRLGAYIADTLILWIPIGVIGLVLFWSDINATLSAISDGRDVDSVLGGGFLLRLGVYFLIALVAQAAYFTLLIAARGATLGMSFVGIHVVDEQGQNPSIPRSLGRWAFTQAFSTVSGIVPYLGSVLWLLDPLWMLWDPEKQTLHDKVAKTWVLKRVG